jgi:hypothetical protein
MNFGRASSKQVIDAFSQLRFELGQRQIPHLRRKWLVGNGRCATALQERRNLATVIHNIVLGHQDPVVVRNRSFGLARQNA